MVLSLEKNRLRARRTQLSSGQIFLKTGQNPAVKIGSFQHITVKALDYHFTVSVDGQTVVDITRP